MSSSSSLPFSVSGFNVDPANTLAEGAKRGKQPSAAAKENKEQEEERAVRAARAASRSRSLSANSRIPMPSSVLPSSVSHDQRRAGTGAAAAATGVPTPHIPAPDGSGSSALVVTASQVSSTPPLAQPTVFEPPAAPSSSSARAEPTTAELFSTMQAMQAGFTEILRQMANMKSDIAAVSSRQPLPASTAGSSSAPLQVQHPQSNSSAPSQSTTAEARVSAVSTALDRASGNFDAGPELEQVLRDLATKDSVGMALHQVSRAGTNIGGGRAALPGDASSSSALLPASASQVSAQEPLSEHQFKTLLSLASVLPSMSQSSKEHPSIAIASVPRGFYPTDYGGVPDLATALVSMSSRRDASFAAGRPSVSWKTYADFKTNIEHLRDINRQHGHMDWSMAWEQLRYDVHELSLRVSWFQAQKYVFKWFEHQRKTKVSFLDAKWFSMEVCLAANLALDVFSADYCPPTGQYRGGSSSYKNTSIRYGGGGRDRPHAPRTGPHPTDPCQHPLHKDKNVAHAWAECKLRQREQGQPPSSGSGAGRAH